MDIKDLRDGTSQGGTDPQGRTGGTDTDAASNPGYRAEDKQAKTDLPGDPSLDINTFFADIGKRTHGDIQFPAIDSQPSADDQPAEEPDEKQLLLEMRSTVSRLTAEVKELRAQIESIQSETASCPGERLPGSADGKSGKEEPAKQNKVLSAISSVMFYAVIVAMVLGAFLMRSTSEGKPLMFAGFSAANVLTSSMSDVYPQGSLIITKQVDAGELQVGDDITFMVSEDSSITHRIIGIVENYQGTGSRAFQTQGTKNPNPDKEMVAAANVVGKVIFHSKFLGDFANFVKENWPILIFVLIVVIALISFLKWNANRADEDEDETKDKSKEKNAKARTTKKNKHSERGNESNDN